MKTFKALITQGIPVYWKSGFYTVVRKQDDFYLKGQNGSLTYFEFDTKDLFIIVNGLTFTQSDTATYDLLSCQLSETQSIEIAHNTVTFNVCVYNNGADAYLAHNGDVEIFQASDALQTIVDYHKATTAMIHALKAFKQATEVINHLWHTNPAASDMILINNYPFEVSFDEQTTAIQEWCNTNNY